MYINVKRKFYLDQNLYCKNGGKDIIKIIQNLNKEKHLFMILKLLYFQMVQTGTGFSLVTC